MAKKHLVINQNTGVTEHVTSSVIDKLYNLAKNDLLDANSDVKGRISADAAYEDAIKFLVGTAPADPKHFPDLYIDVNPNNYYVRFRDAEFARLCIAKYGGGKDGCVKADVAAVSSLSDLGCSNNTDIIIADFAAFLNLETLNMQLNGSTNITDVYIGKCAGNNITINNAIGIGSSTSMNVHSLIIGECNMIVGSSAGNNNHIDIVAIRKLNGNVGTYSFRRVTYGKLYLGAEIPPTVTTGYGDSVNNATIIYVPDKTVEIEGVQMTCAQAYAQATFWSGHTAGYESYDFENDPDGIFDVLNV